jgi:hypothetical protein
MKPTGLPFVDEHASNVATGPDEVWQALLDTLPGFRVTAAVPGSELVLEGRHRFSTYAMILRLEPDGHGGTDLRAETDAVFPGLIGGAHRALVIGTRGHVLGMRRLLAAVRRRARRVAARDTTAGPDSVRTGCVGATPTGLEPAASAVTGRRANQLRYGA